MLVKSLAVDGLKLAIKTFAADDRLPDVLMRALQAIDQWRGIASDRLILQFSPSTKRFPKRIYTLPQNQAIIFTNMTSEKAGQEKIRASHPSIVTERENSIVFISSLGLL